MSEADVHDERPLSDAEEAAARHDQLTTAPNATEEDAAPRIAVTDRGDGVRRIDILDDAAVRPGADPADPAVLRAEDADS
ncbi:MULTISPECIES: hypothetical protein [unclassified Plantibacter]|jgi:hypothetical protein|uniref:hypothetical protein n=1 Tax=unclassified Plantibacter TaxID=2624265 RepID=UPI003D357098